MQVFKFGGSSLWNAGNIRNLEKIIRINPDCRVVIVSALAKTTNALEEVARLYYSQTGSWREKLEEIRQFHAAILNDLFPGSDHPAHTDMDSSFAALRDRLSEPPGKEFNKVYDQIVSLGEIWSTRMVFAWLSHRQMSVKWLDARNLVITDHTFREAVVDWDQTENRIIREIRPDEENIFIVPGFIGGTTDYLTTTLGREGSDYSAAIFGHVLDADCVVIWKDVPGVLNGDPGYFPVTEKLDEISYLEAIELAFYGAKVIHPKTIKPLYNKGIPLWVKPFQDPGAPGTLIHRIDKPTDLIPVYVIKGDQILISIRPRDYSFIINQSLGKIFSLFDAHRIRVNLIQNSAISLSVCADNNPPGVEKVISMLGTEFSIAYNTGVDLITIRHYTSQAIEKMTSGKEILIEQKSRQTVHLVLRDTGPEPVSRKKPI